MIGPTGDTLDHHQVHDSPFPMYLGELPRVWSEIPAPVVLNLCGVYPQGDPQGRKVLGLPLLDVLDRSIAPTRIDFERFLQSAHEVVSGAPSYWHCHAGINRSSFALAAYLHLYQGMRISEAIEQLRSRRVAMVLCNHVFEGLLREWYGGPDEQEFQRFDLATYLRERTGSRNDGS